jgi:hypothetical protein
MGIPAPKAGKPHKKIRGRFRRRGFAEQADGIEDAPEQQAKKAKGHTLQ